MAAPRTGARPAASAQLPKCKAVLLGAPCVGKTSLINRFMYEQFTRDYETTVGIDYFTKKVSIGDRLVSLQIWDTAGQEHFQSLIPTYIRDAQIAVIVYDVSDPKTFEMAKVWHAKVLDAREDGAVCVLAENKADLPVRVDEGAVAAFADGHGIPRVRVSARDGHGVQELFQKVVELVRVAPVDREEAAPVPLAGGVAPAGRRCC